MRRRPAPWSSRCSSSRALRPTTSSTTSARATAASSSWRPRSSARGVGVELDRGLVAKARKSAKEAGVGDRVRFLRQDLFKTSLREATVVTLFLYPDVNLRLRPKLLRELRPGTRVVSHAFDMGDWEPTRKITVNSSTVFLWIVPERTGGRAAADDADERG